MKKQVGVALLLAWALFFGLAGAAQAVKFRYENLGTLGGHQSYGFFDGKQAAINDAGQVTGFCHTSDGTLHAFVKPPGQDMLDLGALIPGSGQSCATGLNNGGVVAGWYKDSIGTSHACKWLPQPGGGYNFIDFGAGSIGHGINDAGYLVGATISNGQVWPPAGDPVTLGVLAGNDAGTATAINNGNTIVGYARVNSSGEFTACIWYPSGSSYSEPTSLFGVANSRANAINSSGQAVGDVMQSFWFHAALKNPGAEGWQDLGTLVPNEDALAYDINDAGMVVGEADDFSGTNAFLWTSGSGMQNLNNLVVNLPVGVRLTHAMAINKRGEIAGYMATSGGATNGVFKLTPVAAVPLSLLLD